MNPELYQRLASRTECDQDKALYRMADGGKGEAHLENGNTLPIRVNHAVIGLMGEVGELATAVEKWVYYGGKLDVTNVKEEAGDCLWYITQLLNSLGLSMAEVMEANILKLKTRYPEKFSTWESVNRDLAAERLVLEKASSQTSQDLDSQGGREPVYDWSQVRPVGKEITAALNRGEDPTGCRPTPGKITDAINKVTDAVVARVASEQTPTVNAGPDRDWGCSCGKINAPYDKKCRGCGKASPLLDGTCEAIRAYPVHDWDSEESTARCRKCRAYRHMESGCMPCPARPYIVQGESSAALMNELAASVKEAGLPVQPHPTHEWDSAGVNASCRKCGAYKHLGSGFLACRGTAKVDDQPRAQNGHGWSESEIMEGEY